jgi:hypothetical protein
MENGRVLVYCAGEKGNISEVIASINQRTLLQVEQNMVKRLNACIHMSGRYLKHLLWALFQVLLYYK